MPLMASAAMSSSNYTIQFDSINVGGGNSASDNYSLEDTLGEVATGRSDSDNYSMRAGYQQMDESYLALSTALDVDLGSISGIVGGSATGTADWTVTTDSLGGYQLSVQASTDPALQSTDDSFADYTSTATSSDLTFSILSTAAEFGFTPEGADVVSRFRDDGSVCGTGSLDTSNACWTGFSTTTVAIAAGNSNQPDGVVTTLRMQAEIGDDHIQPAGDYSAVVTVTAIAL
jgi:hypothetical protein